MKNKNQPLVTVIMTAFNAALFIDEAIRSILSQTYQNMQVIIVDDGSTDKTYKIAEKYSLVDKRVEVYRQKINSGPSVASNIALKKAKGEFIARMDADDIAFRDRIEKQVNFLLKNNDVVIVGGQCLLIDDKDIVIGEKKYPLTHKDIYGSLFLMNPIQHPSCMIRGAVIKNKKIIYHNHSILAHDLELIFELSQFGKLANLKDTILNYRQHKMSLSLKDPKRTFKATIEVRKKALKSYGYKPTIKGWIVNFCQIIIVYILPNRVIYSLFHFLRVKRKRSLLTIGFYPIWKGLHKVAYRLFT